MVKGIEHTAIASPDPHKLARWYVEHLDFVINYQSANSKTTFVKASDGSMIEIIESKGAPAAAPDMKAAGLRHLAIAVTDFDAVYERIKGQGRCIPDGAGEEGRQRAGVLHRLRREYSAPAATGKAAAVGAVDKKAQHAVLHRQDNATQTATPAAIATP